MSLMADKTPTTSPSTPQQVPANWQYNMNMYNMNLYQQNPYMYNTTYQAQNYYQYYGQRLPATNAWSGYRGFTPGGQMQAWGAQPQQAQIPQISEAQAQPQQVPTSEQNGGQTTESLNQQHTDALPELPPLPPGPPPSNPAPPGTQDLPRPFLLPNPMTTPIRFNMNVIKPRPPLAPTNALGIRPLSKKQKKKKRKLLQQQAAAAAARAAEEEEEEEEEDEEMEDIPPLPASPPPPPPPPPPVIAPPPPPSIPPLPPLPPQQGPVMVQNPPGFKGSGADWPATLREYVNRCYSKCVTKVDSDRVGVILKGKIMRSTNDGVLWSKNWAEEPLPLLDSDTKPLGLNLGLNLKDKLKLSSRLGPPQQKPQDQPQQRPSLNRDMPSHKRSSYRSSFKRNYSSGSSSSSSSDSEDDSPSNKRRDNKRPSWSSSKRHPSKKSSDKGHLYKEYGAIGGGAGGPVKKEVLDKRAARFSSGNSGGRGKNGLSGPLFVLDSRPNSAYVPRTAWSNIDGPKDSGSPTPCTTGNQDWGEEDLHIVGTSMDIEKPYLRLTSAPDASQVRPPQILARALNMVKEKWEKESDYHYTCEQLKSIRQDLTVQGIRDEFTIKVYETHARIALEKGDHAEFNQCQAQLAQLHTADSKNRGEFIAYRILYYIFTSEFLDLSTLIQKLTLEDKKDECTCYALQMAKHWVTGVNSRFFRLYSKAPKMSSFLIDLFINRERLKSLKVIVRAYRPAVPVDLVTKELAFGTIGDTLEFIDKFGLIYTDSTRTKVDCKLSTPILASV